MEIWPWIFSAWALSYVSIGKKHIRFEHLIWLLFPIDMYGIQVAGATIKPYMIFCALLFIRILLKPKKILRVRSKWSMDCGIITCICLVINIFSSQDGSSIKASLMLLIVWFCTIVYLNYFDEKYFSQICDVMLAAGIGYGIVFMIAFLSIKFDLNLPGADTGTRMEPGIFFWQSNMYQGELIREARLRGFTIDPNTMLGTFLFSGIVAGLRLANGMGKWKEIFAIILAAFCVYQSNSRMGLLCFGVIIIGCVLLGYRMANDQMKRNLRVSLILLSIVFVFACVTTDLISYIISSILSRYANRSGLTDEYGRLTIWKEAFSILWEKNPFLGIGLGRMEYYASTEKACHNSWLEIICAFGLIAGGFMVAHFLRLARKGLQCLIWARNKPYNIFESVIVLGTLGVMLSLLSVDHVAYNYLWMGSGIVAAISENRRKNNMWKI